MGSSLLIFYFIFITVQVHIELNVDFQTSSDGRVSQIVRLSCREYTLQMTLMKCTFRKTRGEGVCRLDSTYSTFRERSHHWCSCGYTHIHSIDLRCGLTLIAIDRYSLSIEVDFKLCVRGQVCRHLFAKFLFKGPFTKYARRQQ